MSHSYRYEMIQVDFQTDKSNPYCFCQDQNTWFQVDFCTILLWLTHLQPLAWFRTSGVLNEVCLGNNSGMFFGLLWHEPWCWGRDYRNMIDSFFFQAYPWPRTYATVIVVWKGEKSSSLILALKCLIMNSDLLLVQVKWLSFHSAEYFPEAASNTNIPTAQKQRMAPAVEPVRWCSLVYVHCGIIWRRYNWRCVCVCVHVYFGCCWWPRSKLAC